MSLSNVIVDAMKYIDSKLETIDSNSVNRAKVRSMVNVVITSRVKELTLLNSDLRKKAIDSVYQSCLLSELKINKGD